MRGFLKSKNTVLFIIVTLVVVSVITLSVSIYVANKVRDELAIKQLAMLKERTEIDTHTFYKELNTSLNMVSGLVVSGIFQDTDVANWSSGIQPILQSNSNITAVSVANISGSEYVVLLNDSLLSYYYINGEDESKTTFYTRDLSNNTNQAIDTIITLRTIGLESYKNHVYNKADTIIWRGFQAMPGPGKKIGLVGTLKTLETKQKEELIISLYVPLDRLHSFLKASAKNVNGDLFLFDKDLKFLNFENEVKDTLNQNLSDYLVSLDEVKNPLYKEAITVLGKFEIGDSIDFQSFNFENRTYWGAFRTTKNNDAGLRIALVLPEDDFFMVLKGKQGFLFFSSLIVLLASALFLVFALRRNLFKESTHELLETKDILKLIKEGEDEYTEFKSTVRMNLFSQKPGKEIELAWLKSVVAFCNTKGGTILIGVNDEGEILGLDADKFPNDDKFLLHVQSLLKDHIGMEFSPYINYKLHESNNKKFLAVHCTPSQKPLFLIANNNEKFYVRSGPASIELSTSKALKYIEDRKKDN